MNIMIFVEIYRKLCFNIFVLFALHFDYELYYRMIIYAVSLKDDMNQQTRSKNGKSFSNISNK